MVHKPISIMILPLFLALTGVLILAVLTAIPSNNNHAFAEESNTTGFGQLQQQPPPANNTGFGQPQQQQQQPQPTNNTGFGQPQPPPQQQQPPINNTGFGQPQQQPPTNNTGFGQPQQQPPTNNTGFGQPQQQPPTNNTGFGQPQQPPTNNTGFGQPTQNNNTGNTQQQNSSARNATVVDAQSILAVHNSERAAVGVPPLVWSDKLAADAKVWADTLAAGKNVGGPHDPEAFAKFGEGENIVTHGPGVTAAVVINMIEQGWVAEKANYHGRVTGFNPGE